MQTANSSPVANGASPLPEAGLGRDACRLNHRRVCITAGLLAVAGAVLAWLVHPAFVLLAALAGVWLILAPDARQV